jgi:hypothetical protein
VLARVAHNSDDFPPARRVALLADPLPQRASILEKDAHETLVYDDTGGLFVHLGIRECTAEPQRDTDRLEVAGQDIAELNKRTFPLIRRKRLAFNDQRIP